MASNNEESVTVRYKGGTYRVPLAYVLEHPGGPDYILDYQNKDITDAFIDADHSQDAEELLAQWRVQDEGSSSGSTREEDKDAGAHTMRDNNTNNNTKKSSKTAHASVAQDGRDGAGDAHRAGRAGALVCLATIAVLCALGVHMWRKTSR